MSNIFKPNVDHKINNNKKVFYSELKENINNNFNENEISLDELLGDRYLFNKTVKVVTKDQVIVTNIAGKVSDRLVTMDNQSIKIEDIKKILLQQKT